MTGWKLAFGKPDGAVIYKACIQRVVNKARFSGSGIAGDAKGPSCRGVLGLLDEGVEQGSLSCPTAIGREPEGDPSGPAGAVFNINELPSRDRPVEPLESKPAARLYFGRAGDGLVYLLG